MNQKKKKSFLSLKIVQRKKKIKKKKVWQAGLTSEPILKPQVTVSASGIKKRSGQPPIDFHQQHLQFIVTASTNPTRPLTQLTEPHGYVAFLACWFICYVSDLHFFYRFFNLGFIVAFSPLFFWRNLHTELD